MIDTKEKIVVKAIELFNNQGIEYVGMRELAAGLGMRIGNITYYFPTKDHLVYHISEQYSSSNAAIHQTFAITNLYDFLKKDEALFKNAVNYKCLMLSMVHLMQQNPIIAEKYKTVESTRRSKLEADFKSLVAKRLLKPQTLEEQWFLVSINSLVNRFWMSEAALTGKRIDVDGKVGHYLKMLAFLFKPYATKKGMADISLFLNEMC